MADQERTEQATPRRRDESRKKGEVARSPEVAAAAGLLAGVLALRAFGPWTMSALRDAATAAFTRPYSGELTTATLGQQLFPPAVAFAKAFVPVAACCCMAAVTASLLQTGFLISGQPLVPKFSRVNPWEGAKRIFSMRGLGELIKSMLKLGLLTAVAYGYLAGQVETLSGLTAAGGLQAVGIVGSMMWTLLLRLALVLALIAGADYMFQRYLFEKNLRMTKQEVKEEFRRSEGDPLIKSRLRRRQAQIARGRMMEAVPKATVVITNPTHYAVALRYEPAESPAPVVVAKGQRLIAQRIKDEARRHHVPVVENPPLARSLFAQTEVGDLIPMDLYQAVAEIIAFVYRLSGRTPAGAQR